METMQAALKNGRNVWDPINMPEQEFQERVETIRKGMKEEGIDVLLLYGNGLNEYGNASYISNLMIRGGGKGALVVIPKKDEIALIYEGPSRGIPSVKETTWIEEVKACGDASKECVKYLKEKNLALSKVGFAGIRQLMPYDQFQYLFESLKGCKIFDADGFLRAVRMVKSERERDEIRRASRIVDRGFAFISEIPLSGIDERKFEAMVNRETHYEGWEDFRMLIAKPLDPTWAFRPAEEAPLSAGETLIVYLATQYERYWAEGIRTFVVEEACLVEVKSESFQSLYQEILEGMIPGKKMSEFYKEALQAIRKSKVDPIQEYGFGQGIGLSLQEFPLISNKDETPLKEGMCFTLRLGVKDQQRGALFIGNTIYVSKNKAHLLAPR